MTLPSDVRVIRKSSASFLFLRCLIAVQFPPHPLWWLHLGSTSKDGANGAQVALGLGWGNGETDLADYLREAGHEGVRRNKMTTASNIVATKFTPSPWRTTAASVVKVTPKSLSSFHASMLSTSLKPLVQIFKYHEQGLRKKPGSVRGRDHRLVPNTHARHRATPLKTRLQIRTKG